MIPFPPFEKPGPNVPLKLLQEASLENGCRWMGQRPKNFRVVSYSLPFFFFEGLQSGPPSELCPVAAGFVLGCYWAYRAAIELLTRAFRAVPTELCRAVRAAAGPWLDRAACCWRPDCSVVLPLLVASRFPHRGCRTSCRRGWTKRNPA
ncbi:hypothetical protein Drorol1_Dr00015803 [Drosera rotundifolia]